MELPQGWRKANLPNRRIANAINEPTATLAGAIANGLGMTISGRDAIGVNTVFACVALLARTMSMLPLKIYGAANKLLSDHELARVMQFPNDEMTGVNFRSAINANAALHGFAIAVITRDAAGRVAQLTPVPSGQVAFTRDEKTKRLKYKITNAFTRSVQEYDFSRILHFRTGLTFDGITNLSPELGLETVVKIARAIDIFASCFYGNGANPATLIQTKHKLSEGQIADLKRQIEANSGSPGMARPLILGQDMEAKTLQQSAQASETVETRHAQDLAICRMFGVPPHKVGIFGDTSSASVEQKALEFIQSTIGPLCVEQEAVYGALLPRAEQGKVYFKHNLGALLRGDTATRNAAFAIGRQGGWLSVNEIRALEEMEPIEGGDVYLEPLNMVQAGSGATGNPGTQTTRQATLPNEFQILNRLP